MFFYGVVMAVCAYMHEFVGLNMEYQFEGMWHVFCYGFPNDGN